MMKHVSLLVRITMLLAVAFVAIGCLESSVTTTTSAALAVAEEGAAAPAEEAPAEEAPTEEAPAEEDAAEAPAEGGDDTEALMAQVCSQCHGLQDGSGADITPEGRGEIEGKEGFAGVWMAASPRDWAATVDRMKGPNACPMTDDEAAAITEWLNENIS